LRLDIHIDEKERLLEKTYVFKRHPFFLEKNILKNFYYFYRAKAKRAIAEVLKHLNEAVADMQMLEIEITRVKNGLAQTMNETMDEISMEDDENNRESPVLEVAISTRQTE